MATRLFVGNVPDSVVEDDLRSAFSSFGEITSLDLKSKPGEEPSKKFAFVSLSASNYNIESCIKHFSNEDFNGAKLYVTRARESFLERLQREREQAKNTEKEKDPPKKQPVLKLNDRLSPRKRKSDITDTIKHTKHHEIKHLKHKSPKNDHKIKKDIDEKRTPLPKLEGKAVVLENGNKKQDSEKKRMESLKKKRQEFKEKQMIIKSGLTAIDKVQNKKIRFDDTEENFMSDENVISKNIKNSKLFDDEDEDSEINFEIKQQFEGKKGQKVLDLQSRYKSDKRFVLDERFVDDEKSENENESDAIEVQQSDEKERQLDILQGVLGVTLKRKLPDDEYNKKKPKIGMLRFDPSQPDHAKFFAPVEETKQETSKKTKKKNKEKQDEKIVEEKIEVIEENRPEVSKEQFYKVSETLKEAIAQPTSFSLRSLFGTKENTEEDPKPTEEESYIPLEPAKKSKVKNPLEPKEKNPFVYDSSDSENEDNEPATKDTALPVVETKAVWKENLFFSNQDQRLRDGLLFFTTTQPEIQKERRELKSVMKKRIYNKERKSQMFQKKIGGRKKTMKKSIRKKS